MRALLFCELWYNLEAPAQGSTLLDYSVCTHSERALEELTVYVDKTNKGKNLSRFTSIMICSLLIMARQVTSCAYSVSFPFPTLFLLYSVHYFIVVNPLTLGQFFTILICLYVVSPSPIFHRFASSYCKCFPWRDHISTVFVPLSSTSAIITNI